MRSSTNILLATGRLPWKGRFWVCFQGIEHGDWGDCGSKAGQACGLAEKRIEGHHGVWLGSELYVWMNIDSV